MSAHFEIRKTRKLLRQRFYVATVGGNGEDLQTSELLPSKKDCYTNINAVCDAVHEVDSSSSKFSILDLTTQ